PLKRGCYPARSNEWGRSRNLDLDVGPPAFCSACRAEPCALSSIRNHLHIFCHILSEWESYSVQGGRKIEHRRDLVNFPPRVCSANRLGEKQFHLPQPALWTTNTWQGALRTSFSGRLATRCKWKPLWVRAPMTMTSMCLSCTTLRTCSKSSPRSIKVSQSGEPRTCSRWSWASHS